MKTLARYQNGNCSVVLQGDGTKFIGYDPPAAPEYPLSIDLKITDRCDRGCPWCHEESTPQGEPASIDAILSTIDGLPAGTELAIGGGDPLSYPHLGDLLMALRVRGLVVNMTVNAAHVRKHSEQIELFHSRGWLHGLGVSWNDEYAMDVAKVHDGNTILHVIVGIHDIDQVIRLLKGGIKVLVLGYKKHGRGLDVYGPERECAISNWASRAPELISAGGHIAFDTLALQQLGIQSLVQPEVWEKHFMGDDGEFTMYVDAVKMEFARSSTSPRAPIDGRGIKEMFALVRQGL